ncbi:MAG: GNAT family N-acetyltransferase [Gemella sp.]|nr:GNAT family N-acetyltransferase [Gemella sp.]
MEFVYKDYTEVKIDELVELYKDVQWSAYYEDPSVLENAVKNSLYVRGVYLEDELVALIRVVGDGHYMIYVQDILVKEKYQRQGIGSKLLKYVLDKYKNVRQTMLITENEEKTVAFYNSLGFTDIKVLYDGVAFGIYR